MTRRTWLPFAVLLTLWALVAVEAHAQTTLTTAEVAGCPSPTPNTKTNQGWPPSNCQYQFYPLTDTTHAIASVSKTAPAYAHTLQGYLPTAQVIACPAGAHLSADSKTCADTSGKDLSALVTVSSLPTFSTFPPAPTTRSFTVNWAPVLDRYQVEHSGDGGQTWDANPQSIPANAHSATFSNLPVTGAHCFRVTSVSATLGNSDAAQSCIPPGTGQAAAPAQVTAQ